MPRIHSWQGILHINSVVLLLWSKQLKTIFARRIPNPSTLSHFGVSSRIAVEWVKLLVSNLLQQFVLSNSNSTSQLPMVRDASISYNRHQFCCKLPWHSVHSLILVKWTSTLNLSYLLPDATNPFLTRHLAHEFSRFVLVKQAIEDNLCPKDAQSQKCLKFWSLLQNCRGGSKVTPV